MKQVLILQKHLYKVIIIIRYFFQCWKFVTDQIVRLTVCLHFVQSCFYQISWPMFYLYPFLLHVSITLGTFFLDLCSLTFCWTIIKFFFRQNLCLHSNFILVVFLPADVLYVQRISEFTDITQRISFNEHQDLWELTK